MVNSLLPVISLLATVALSETQDELAGRLAGRTWLNYLELRPSGSSTIAGGDLTSPFTISTLSPDSTTSWFAPGFNTILTSSSSPTTTTLLTSTKAIPSSDGSLVDRSSTPVVDSLPTNSNMAPPTDIGGTMDNDDDKNAGASSNKTLVITLSTVLSVAAFLILFGSIVVCYRIKRGRLPAFRRGISPINDEEIESWKVTRNEKPTSTTTQERHTSVGSARKPPSVIVYQNQAQVRSSGEHSPRSFYSHGYRRSMDVPQTPVLARAPNSRPGLTDETVEGDVAFVPSARRHSRLSKLPSPKHARTRSNRSSFSMSSYQAWAGSTRSPRASNEYSHYYPRSSQSYDRKHTRIYSGSSNPPRLSFDDDFSLSGLSPRPLIRSSDFKPDSEIGRAIG